MPEAGTDSVDDLDDFFSAAEEGDPLVLANAADKVTRRLPLPAAGEPYQQGDDAAGDAFAGLVPGESHGKIGVVDPLETGIADLRGQYIAVDPSAMSGVPQEKAEPFILIPAHLNRAMPWWFWASVAASFAVLAAAVLFLPGITLNRLIAQLGDRNEAHAQSVMRHLVQKADDRTINSLYNLAHSPDNAMLSRIRAIDTLGLIDDSKAENALLRLELATHDDERIRAAAVAARKQRESFRTQYRVE